VQDPKYDPFALKALKDEVVLGTAKPERIARVKAQYGDKLTDAEISDVLSLGAPSHNFGQRIKQPDKDALKALATSHQVRFNPILNSPNTAGTFIAKKLSEAGNIKDPVARARAMLKWQNMTDEYKDLDGKPETPDNYIIRNKNDVNDVFAIDGLQITDRNKAIVQRGVYERFPTAAERRDNKDFIDKIYKKYLRKYLKPEDREKHPFTPELAQKIDAKLTAEESVFSRTAAIVRNILATWGVRVKAQNGSTIMTTPNYGYITSKVASDYYRGYVIPQLAANSAWKTQIPTPYSFVDDPKGFLNNKKFRESMLVVHQAGGGLKPNYQFIAQSLASHGNDLANGCNREKHFGHMGS
jgi:hypothetical protein